MKRILLLSACIRVLFSGTVGAQTDSLQRRELFKQKNKLFRAEQVLLYKGFFASSIGRFIAADSLSNIQDSVRASTALIGVNPDHLVAFWDIQGIAPKTENLDKMNLLSSARKQYGTLLSSSLKKPRAKQYQVFKKMLEEDQVQRDAMNSCTDSLNMYVLSRKLRTDDSIRADYLYRYVIRNGWPDINNGGLFAGIIAIHDHSRHHFYFPKIKQALIRGEGDLQTYRLMKYWIDDGSSWQEVESILSNCEQETFDVSGLLRQNIPDSLTPIINAIRKMCPVKLYFEWDNKMINGTFPNTLLELARKSIIESKPHIISRFLDHLYTACPDQIEPGVWKVWGVPAQEEREYLRLHVVAKNTIGLYRTIKTPMENLYDDLLRALPEAGVKKQGDSIRVIYTELTTFDLNKAVIKQSAHRTFEQFAYILNRYGQTKFFLDGHTDNTGDSTANRSLSVRRAAEAGLLLQQYGIEKERMKIRGFGSSVPAEANDTDKGRQANRRVEFVIYPYEET